MTLNFSSLVCYTLFLLMYTLSLPQPSLAQQNMIAQNGAVIRILNKITTKTFTLNAPNQQIIDVKDALRIRVRICYQNPHTQRPESIAFVEISPIPHTQNSLPPSFSGWMFASSPSLSTLEHPVYDVWLLTCSENNTQNVQE